MIALTTLFTYFISVGIFSQTKPSLKSRTIVCVGIILLRVLGLLEGLHANGGLI